MELRGVRRRWWQKVGRSLMKSGGGRRSCWEELGGSVGGR